MFARTSIAGFAFAMLALLGIGVSSASAQSIRYGVLRGSTWYEVIEGSGTGGRFVHRPGNIGGVPTAGYTDRAQRGEHVFVYVSGGTIAEYTGVRSDNNVLNIRVRNVWMPFFVVRQVSLNPLADNVYSFVKVPGRPEVRKRLPIGRR